MKQKILVLDFKEILHKLFPLNRFKADTKEKGNKTVCPCQELVGLKSDMGLICERLEKLNSSSCRAQEVSAENINVEKIVLENLSFNLGNIDVDAINGTMNIGITVNLPSGALSLPDKIQVPDNKTNKIYPTTSSEKQPSKKKTAFNICINPSSFSQEITPKIIRTDNNK